MLTLEEIIEYKFQEPKLLEEALTHPSMKRISKASFTYQRLEFLGDKVLGLIIGEYLFRNFKSENEGQISKRHAFLICGKSVAKIAKNIKLGAFIKLSANQEVDKGRESENILENTMEALIGAIFLDGGLEVTTELVLNLFKEELEKIEYEDPHQDPKSKLQEWFQKKYKKIPEYHLIKKNDEIFIVALTIEGKEFFGQAKTIKAAEKEAALNFLNSPFYKTL